MLTGPAHVAAKQAARAAVEPLTLFDVIELVLDKAAALSDGASMRVKSDAPHHGTRVEVRVTKVRKLRAAKAGK